MLELSVNYYNTHWITRNNIREEYARLQDNKCYYCQGMLNGALSHEAEYMRINKNLFSPNFLNGLYIYTIIMKQA